MSGSACRSLLLPGCVVALAGCGEPAQYRFGTNVTGLRFKPLSPNEGVFPSDAVLANPQNPFRFQSAWLTNQPDGGVGTKWQLLAGPGGVPAFYAFATALAREPTGENQLYTAQMLGQVALSGAYDESVPEEQVRQMAIRAYQATLIYFPNSVSFFADGVTFFSLDVLAYQGAVALGDPMRGWALVEPGDGGVGAVVRTAEYVSPDGGQ